MGANIRPNAKNRLKKNVNRIKITERRVIIEI